MVVSSAELNALIVGVAVVSADAHRFTFGRGPAPVRPTSLRAAPASVIDQALALLHPLPSRGTLRPDPSPTISVH
jgi:hypothetical protein